MSHGQITDAALEELRSRVGSEVRAPAPFLTQATADSVRHWAYGIGDYNPLWMEPGHRSGGGVLAPPSMLYAFDKRSNSVGGGLPGVHAMFAGTTWRFHRWVTEGDRVSGSASLKDVIEREGRFAGRSVQQIGEVTFHNQDGDMVAVGNPYSFRVERDQARERELHKATPAQHVYTEDELLRIDRDIEAEEVRGADTRYCDDVVADQALPHIIRGPITVSDLIMFVVGWGGLYVRSHADAWRWFRKHPGGGPRNAFNVPEAPERVHWDHDFAREVGVPAAYDYGPQRIAWLGSLVTNWMGDDGFLEELDVQVRRFVLVSDTVWGRGRVVSTTRPGDGGDGTVEVELWAENQRGEEVARGTAKVRLPCRS